jgi:hypothetical protein
MMDRQAFSSDTTPGLREQDEAMLEQLLLGLSSPSRMHVVLSSPSRLAVERYRQLLVERLRRRDDVRIETFLSSNTEQLVARFNALVGAMPLQQALDREAADTSTPTVFVVHDTPLVQLHELRLLAQLARDFPGASVRVLLAADPDNDVAARVQVLGKNQVLHWAIEPPSPSDISQVDTLDTPAEEAEASEDESTEIKLDAWAQPRRLRPVDSKPESAPAGQSHTGGPSQRALRRAAVAFLLGMLGLYVVVAISTAWKGSGEKAVEGAKAEPAASARVDSGAVPTRLEGMAFEADLAPLRPKAPSRP